MQSAAEKSIGNQDRSASGKILPNPSKVSELCKTTFTNFLHMFGESEVSQTTHPDFELTQLGKGICPQGKIILIDPSASLCQKQ